MRTYRTGFGTVLKVLQNPFHDCEVLDAGDHLEGASARLLWSFRFWPVSVYCGAQEQQPLYDPERKFGRLSLPLCRAPALPDSNFGLLGHIQGVLDFNAKIPDGTFELGVTQQQLNRPKVLRPFVNQGGLGPP